jgi:hypothetical protein
MVSRHFGYSSEHPTLKKLYLSFIITHIDRNTKVALKTYKQYVNRQSNECEIFIRGWLDHSKDSKQFDDHCRQLLLESGKKLETSLTSMLNKHDVEDYIDAESLYIFDQKTSTVPLKMQYISTKYQKISSIKASMSKV